MKDANVLFLQKQNSDDFKSIYGFRACGDTYYAPARQHSRAILGQAKENYTYGVLFLRKCVGVGWWMAGRTVQ